jgi:predicted signal transduction protein with EAL and GGDEF domain
MQRRLVDLGCPIVQVRRLVQEVADHREDLRQAALSEGLSGSGAETRADAQLGNPLDLAERLAMALRQSSWWGRHFIIGFCLLPLLAVPVLWGLLVLLGLWLEFAMSYGLNSNQLHIAADKPDSFHHILMAVHCTDYLAIALVTLLFCWLARRSAVSLTWMVIACGICSLYALFFGVHIQPHYFSLSIYWAPQWMRSAIPLLIVATIYTLRRRTARCLHENVVA